MRGAHRGVRCSKSTPLIEAELFAAERKRPAPDGRALSCAAPYARKIQGLTASQNLPDARNRAPVSLVSPRDRRESRCKGGFGGVKRGQGNHTVPLPPFAPAAGRRHFFPAVGTALPAGEHRHLRRQTAASSQNPAAGSGSTQISRVFFNFPCLQLTFPIFHGILNYRKQKEPMPASISSLINGIRHLVYHHQRAVRSH